MALHDDLLDLAIRLLGPAAAPPAVALAVPLKPEADLRRAISTAYYALFHLLINVSTTRGVATAALRPYVARNFEHRHMLAVCKRYTVLAADLTGQPVPAEIGRIADSFVQLQNARHKADYNVKDSVNPVEAQTFVQLAQDAFTDWTTVAPNPAADTFMTELLLGGVKER
jgi:hypothetical protein